MRLRHLFRRFYEVNGASRASPASGTPGPPVTVSRQPSAVGRQPSVGEHLLDLRRNGLTQRLGLLGREVHAVRLLRGAHHRGGVEGLRAARAHDRFDVLREFARLRLGTLSDLTAPATPAADPPGATSSPT